jgi:hypothetical protein
MSAPQVVTNGSTWRHVSWELRSSVAATGDSIIWGLSVKKAGARTSARCAPGLLRTVL